MTGHPVGTTWVDYNKRQQFTRSRFAQEARRSINTDWTT